LHIRWIFFLADGDCKEIIVVCDREDFQAHSGITTTEKIKLTSGGASRQESVSNGLSLVRMETVFIHDGARPYLSSEELERLKKRWKAKMRLF